MSTPNMNINTPTVGLTSGPQYATDLNNAFLTIDSHDHSSGNGVKVTPAGLNISSDLSFLGNNATTLRSARFQVQSPALNGASDLGCLYVTGVDLYYNDGNGNQIQMTQSGSIAGASGSISGLSSPASANYVSGSQTFVWQSAALTPANLDAGSVIFRNISASSYGITVSPPTLSSNYNIILPALPASQKIMTLDNTGALSAPYSIDNSSLEISSNVIQIKDSGVTTSKLNNDSVTQAKRAALGQQVGTLNTSFSSSSLSEVSIVGVIITSTGRPVKLELSCATTGVNSLLSIEDGVSVNPYGTLYLYRDATLISRQRIGINGAVFMYIPVTSINAIDVGTSAASHSYQLKVSVDSTDYTFRAENIQLIAYEL